MSWEGCQWDSGGLGRVSVGSGGAGESCEQGVPGAGCCEPVCHCEMGMPLQARVTWGHAGAARRGRSVP